MEMLTQLGIVLWQHFFTKGIDSLWENKKMLSLYWKTLFLNKYRTKQIRFSISYLFRIRIPSTNSFLLVLNRRIENQLQPVGGAYKRYGDDKLFETWGFQRDNKNNGLGTDQISEDDLRFFVRGKNVISVIKWFEEGRERECSANREFIEELIETQILDKNMFEKIQYRHIKRKSDHLKWSEFHQCHEILIYDIFELLPTNEQKEALVRLQEIPFDLNNGYAIVESSEIEQCRLLKNNKQVAKIGEHTKYII